MAILKLEGQEVELDERMAGNDKALLEFVATFSPELANATITRKKEGEQIVVTLTKRAGSKGIGSSTQQTQIRVVAALVEAPLYLNPALLLAWQLKQAEAAGCLTLDQLITLQSTLADAMQQGETEVELVEESLKCLLKAPVVPSTLVPPGF